MFKNRKHIIFYAVSLILTAIVSIFGTLFAFSSINHLDKFMQVRNILKLGYYQKVDENKLMEGALAGMAASIGDKYTAYYTTKQWSDLEEDLEGSYVGIGVRITVDTKGLVTLSELFDKSSAKTQGMKVGDKIVKVNDLDVRSLKSDKVIDMIRGKENTYVKITILRGNGQLINFNIKREKIKVDNVTSKILDGNIGLITIRMFDAQVNSYFNKNLDSLLKSGIKGLIIDLRDDPGGYYDQVVAIADRLLPKATIVYTEDRNKVKDIKYSDSTELKLPIAVLINGNSASASEILAGALKDNHKGSLVGTRSYGKGLVQSSITFKDGSALKYTIQRYFTPSGVCIQGKGIEPDYEVKPDKKYVGVPASQVPEQDDLQLKKAIEVVKNS